jgi:hypothetical protein
LETKSIRQTPKAGTLQKGAMADTEFDGCLTEWSRFRHHAAGDNLTLLVCAHRLRRQLNFRANAGRHIAC